MDVDTYRSDELWALNGARMVVSARSLRVYRIAKRIAELIAAPLLLVALSPVLAVIALAVLIDSGGPILFRQVRAGRHCKPFRILKFRTMYLTAPTYSEKVSPQDPRITNLGRVLRAAGLDELPQLWNVVRGEMSLIGPRPEQLELVQKYDDWQMMRFAARPGITGWWQIHHRDSAPMYANTEKDLFYVANESLLLDVRIIVGTFKVLASPLWRKV